jgi:hypothetical protein
MWRLFWTTWQYFPTLFTGTDTNLLAPKLEFYL